LQGGCQETHTLRGRNGNRAQIVETAAENLGILGEGETLPSYESADLTQAYLEVYSELQALGLAPWSYTGTVPDQYVGSVAMLVAEARATKYQVPAERYARIRSEGSGQTGEGVAMLKLRSLQARAKLGATEIEMI